MFFEQVPRAAMIHPPLDLGANHNKVTLEALEQQILHYIIVQANSGNQISIQFIRELFETARKMLK